MTVRREAEIHTRWGPILQAVQLGKLEEAEELGHQIGAQSLPTGSRNPWDYHAVMERQIRRLDTQVTVGDSRPVQQIVGFEIPSPAASDRRTGGADADPPG